MIGGFEHGHGKTASPVTAHCVLRGKPSEQLVHCTIARGMH
jgi:hypothetical protein